MPLHHVKELLDHASIATTDTYLNAGRMPAKRKRTRSPRTRTQKRPELRLIEDPGEVWAVMYPLGALPPLVFPPGKPDGVDCRFRKFIIWKAELDQKRDNLEVGVEAFVVGGIKWISVYLVHYVVQVNLETGERKTAWEPILVNGERIVDSVLLSCKERSDPNYVFRLPLSNLSEYSFHVQGAMEDCCGEERRTTSPKGYGIIIRRALRPLDHMKELLGHANISTTDTYLNSGRVHLRESVVLRPRVFLDT